MKSNGVRFGPNYTIAGAEEAMNKIRFILVLGVIFLLSTSINPVLAAQTAGAPAIGLIPNATSGHSLDGAAPAPSGETALLAYYRPCHWGWRCVRWRHGYCVKKKWGCWRRPWVY